MMNNRNLLRIFFVCWLIVGAILLFVLIDCKQKSKGTFEPYVPEEDPKTMVCVSMESVRVSGAD